MTPREIDDLVGIKVMGWHKVGEVLHGAGHEYRRWYWAAEPFVLGEDGARYPAPMVQSEGWSPYARLDDAMAAAQAKLAHFVLRRLALDDWEVEYRSCGNPMAHFIEGGCCASVRAATPAAAIALALLKNAGVEVPG